MLDWRMQEIRHCRTRKFSTRILTREEVLVLEQFKRKIDGFSWFYESSTWSMEEKNAYAWMASFDELNGRADVLERLEWAGAILKAEDGWHLTAKGRKMHAKLAKEGRILKKKSRSKPVRTGRHEKQSKGPKVLMSA